jgi:hypothetical protein
MEHTDCTFRALMYSENRISLLIKNDYFILQDSKHVKLWEPKDALFKKINVRFNLDQLAYNKSGFQVFM